MVQTAQGFSVSYQNRFLYSKYAPSRAIEGAIDSLTILPGTLILSLSPALWLGLDKLIEKLPQDCFVLGIETDKNLHEFAEEKLAELKKSGKVGEKVALLPFSENEYIVNILSGERLVKDLSLPHISTFRRALPIEMSAGTQFSKEKYFAIASLSQNTIASFWKNRITLTKLGRLYSRNLFKNLANLPVALDFNNLAHKISKPIFVFGAGESIEETVSNIPKQLLEKCFVIAVDAASASLKAMKIKIDAIVAVEGQLAIEKAYIGGTAKSSLLIADITSRKAVTRHTRNAVTYFASKYTDSQFFKNLSQKEFFPQLVPPLGSVGLTAVYIALLLRANVNVPVFMSGLDFSFSLGRTHAKNAPAHISRLSTTNRFNPAENYAAAFRTGARQICGKNNIPVFTGVATASGNAVSAAGYYSVMFFVCEIMAYASSKLLMPLISCVTALSFISAINPSLNLGKAAQSVKGFVTKALGFIMLIFTALMTITGLSGNAADTLGSKTIRFAASSFIPVIGSSVSEAYSAVKSSLGVIRTSVGVIGVIVVFIIVLRPLLLVISMKIAVSLAETLHSMFSLESSAGILSGINSVLSIAMSIVIAYSLFFITATSLILMSASGG